MGKLIQRCQKKHAHTEILPLEEDGIDIIRQIVETEEAKFTKPFMRTLVKEILNSVALEQNERECEQEETH